MNPRGDAEPFGGAEITQHLFAGSIAIDRARVELVVAKFQDGAKHCVCGRSVMNPGSVSAVAERHGAEGDVSNWCFGHSNVNGQRRQISKREAIVLQLVNKSAAANLKALQMLLNMLRETEGPPAEDSADARVVVYIP